MKKNNFFKRYFAYSLFGISVFLLLGLSSCAAGRGGKGKMKRGKPIPCPVKDC